MYVGAEGIEGEVEVAVFGYVNCKSLAEVGRRQETRLYGCSFRDCTDD